MGAVPSGTSVTGLMRRQAPRADALAEGLALANLEAELFQRRSAVPVLARYVLLEKLAEGGLGVVFRAYDPDLDRGVALKLLRLRPGSTTDDGGLEDDALLREARIMARLSHPNVVTVHDVGTYTEQDLGLVAGRDDLGIPPHGVFLVMELMGGGSLRDVLQDPPPPRELMSMLQAAGRGIAAAHALGIVHRDFKPANVLVGTDGAVRVADFGLALSVATGESDTEDGGGTPAYMAPEQLGEGKADARSDQYAFALTCWVALYGGHPFPERSGRIRGPVPAAPHRRGVPRAIHKVLRRALSLDPTRRYPDMDAMLRAFAAARSHRVRDVGLGLGVVGLAALGLWSGGETEAITDPCATAGSTIDAVWSEAERDRLREAFVSTGLAFARDSWATVDRILQTYAQRWRAAARAACEDTHVHHVQSEAQLDRRSDCLEGLRRELASTITVLRQADPSTLANTVQVVHDLGWIEACEEPDRGMPGLPDDPVRRERLLAARDDLATARRLEVLGRYDEAMTLAREIRDRSEPGDEALRAEADFRMGSIAGSRGQFQTSRHLLLRAIQAAEGAREDALVADGWIRLLWIAGVELQDLEQGELWSGFARAALRRLGDDPLREAELVHNLGGFYYRMGRWEDARAHYEQALRAQQALLPEGDPRIARTLNHIANVLLEEHEPARSLVYSKRSLALRREVLGAQHPLVAASLNNIASAHIKLGAWDDAKAAIDGSLAIVGGTRLPEETIALTLEADLEMHRLGLAPREEPPR